MIELREYQTECVNAMQGFTGKAALIVMATGLGKTATFTHYLRLEVTESDHTCLILSHRDELVHQPLGYLEDIPCGTEIAEEYSHGEKIISASVQSLVGRLHNFNPREIDVIIIDEAHHAAAPTYRKILEYFSTAKVFGFTATAHRGDGIGLGCVFEKILFERDLRWGIKHGFLCDVECEQVRLKYSMESVKIMNGDFSTGALAEAMSGTALGVAEIYTKKARGPTIIFAASVPEAEEITASINKAHGDIARLIDSRTKNRNKILKAFEDGRIKVLVNFGVLTEGVDTRNAETILIARPKARTNVGLYAQMVGRGLRPYPGKTKCLVIDCIGISNAPLCTAATLLGEDLPPDEAQAHTPIPKLPEDEPLVILSGSEIPKTWVQSKKAIDIWAKGKGVYTHDIAWYPLKDGRMILSIPNLEFILEPPDGEGLAYLWRNGTRCKEKVGTQRALDYVKRYCSLGYSSQRYLWDSTEIDKWGKKRVSTSQIQAIQRLAPDYEIDTAKMTRGDASRCIQFLKYEYTKKDGDNNAKTS